MEMRMSVVVVSGRASVAQGVEGLALRVDNAVELAFVAKALQDTVERNSVHFLLKALADFFPTKGGLCAGQNVED
jgi:hypothetical protein